MAQSPEAATTPLLQTKERTDPLASKIDGLSAVMKGIGSFLFLMTFASAIALVVLSVQQSAVVNQYYLTSTFMTTYDSDLPQLTWAPNGTDGPFAAGALGVVSNLINNALQCLSTSKVGPSTCDPTLPTYATCLRISTCVQGVNTTNSNAPFRAARSVYDGVWHCASNAWLVSEGNQLAYAACAAVADPYTVLEVMQDTYTSTLLGSYNWLLFMCTSLWLLAGFGLYTAWFCNDNYAPTAYGKFPWKTYGARTGPVLTGLALLWTLSALSYICASAWRASGASGSLNLAETHSAPTSVQTTLVTLLFIILSAAYFAAEWWEQWVLRNGDKQGAVAPEPAAVQVEDGASSMMVTTAGKYRRTVRAPLRYFMRVPDPGSRSNQVNDLQTTPLLVSAWTDALALTDALLVTAFVGATMDVLTAELCLIFMGTLLSGVCHTAFQRLLYEGYVVESVKDSANAFRLKGRQVLGDDAALYGVRVMGFAVHTASLLFAVGPLTLIYLRYGSYAMVICYTVFIIILPEVYWMFVHIVVEVEVGRPGFHFDHQFWGQLAFDYALLIRTVLAIVLYVQFGTSSSAAQGASASMAADLLKWVIM